MILNNAFFEKPLHLSKNRKNKLILNQTLNLTKFHYKKCNEYKKNHRL